MLKCLPDAESDKPRISLLCEPKHFFLAQRSLLIVYRVHLLQTEAERLFLLNLNQIDLQHLQVIDLMGSELLIGLFNLMRYMRCG